MTAAAPNEPGAADVAPRETARPGRFRELDGLRGIAALAVVFSHYGATHNHHYPEDPPAFHGFVWGGLGVQLFFMISGFVILLTARRASRPSDFVISRAARLYPPYWISLFFGVGLLLLHPVPRYEFTVVDVVANLTMVQRWFMVHDVVDVYWTLAIEMQFYVGVFVLLHLTRCRLSDRVVLRAALLWSILSWAFVLVASRFAAPTPAGDPTWVKVTNNALVAEYAPFFVLGMVLFLVRETGQHRVWAVGAFLSAALSPIVLRGGATVWVTVAFAVLFTVVTLSPRVPALLFPPLQWYGKISYSLYIVHVVPGYILIHHLWPVLGRNLSMLVALAVVSVLAWLLQKHGEERLGRAAKRGLTSLRTRVDARAGRGSVRPAPRASLEGSTAAAGPTRRVLRRGNGPLS